MKQLSDCPVCGQHSFSELFPSSYYETAVQAAEYFLTDRRRAVHGRIVRCDGCGFIFTSPQFTAEEYEQIYRDVASVENPPGRSHAVSARYNRLAGQVRKFIGTGRFFDFGCGGGEFLDCMAEFQGIGLEFRSLDFHAQKAKDDRIIASSLSAALKASLVEHGSFEFVTAWDVVEHLPDLADDIAILRSLLKPGGWFFCTVPNVASLAARMSGEQWNCYLLEHLWYFSPNTLTKYFERQGFVGALYAHFYFPLILRHWQAG
ncbi:MAG: methyltransferase domain-containing protein [Pseudolabrys sp.]|nr:methyltransferase domain-containing protein [Pseudolabrys sp.]